MTTVAMIECLFQDVFQECLVDSRIIIIINIIIIIIVIITIKLYSHLVLQWVALG